MKVDIMIATSSPYDQTRLARALRMKDATGTEGSYAAPEDVIVKKMVYYREGQSDKHLRDIAGMLKTRSTVVDRDYVTKWAAHFGCAEIWNRVQESAKDLP
jgi:hypothetical protein